MKISDIGEMELIKRIHKKVGQSSGDIIKGIGDDAAVVSFDKEHYMLFTTDSLFENVHFSLDFFTPEQIGKKAIESNASDIAAMGGFPKYTLVSLILPKNTDVKFIDRLYYGMNKASKKYKISIIGGNLSSGKNIAITIMMIGLVEKKYLCLRKNAKANDLIAVTNTLGNSKAGLELLANNKKGSSIDYFLNPKARLVEARLLAKSGINAMEDVSDGLASEIINICNESKTGAVIYKEKIPINKKTIKDIKKLSKNPYDFALYGGEDYELVFTINKNQLKKLNNIKNKAENNKKNTNGKNKLNFSVVGKILKKKEGIYLLDKSKKIKLKRGYEHF